MARQDNNPEERVKQIACAEWESLLLDALDGTIAPHQAAAFEAHRSTCVACSQLFEEAKRGGEWLKLLEGEPEIPGDLVGRILAQTSGTAAVLPLAGELAGVPAWVSPAQVGWLPRVERHAAQSRWIMTAAMAFFSIAFTLNLTGIRLSGLTMDDLKPTSIVSGLTRGFYEADAHVMRYYDNLRFVYELESRVREIRRQAPLNQNSAPPPAKPKDKNTGGSASKTGQSPDPPPANSFSMQDSDSEPLLTGFPRHARLQPNPYSKQHGTHKKIDRAERSLA